MANEKLREALRLAVRTAEAMVYHCGHPRGGCESHCDPLVKVIDAGRAALLAVPAAGAIPAAWKDEGLQDRINEAVDRAQESPAAGEPPAKLLHTEIPVGCYCKPGQCMAPVVMGRQMPCRDPLKAAQLIQGPPVEGKQPECGCEEDRCFGPMTGYQCRAEVEGKQGEASGCDNEISITIRGQRQVAIVMEALRKAGFVVAQADAPDRGKAQNASH